MNFIKIFLFCFLTCFSITVFAQEQQEESKPLTILKTDITSFDTLQVHVKLNVDKQALKEDFKVLDNDESELDFQFYPESSGEVAPFRNIYFLIDASVYTEGKTISTFKRGMERVLTESNFGENDYINIGYFDGKKDDKGGVLNDLSTDFGQNLDGFKKQLSQIINAVDTTASYPAYKAIYDAIFTLTDTKSSGENIIIIISTAYHNTLSSFNPDDLGDRAKETGVKVFTLNFEANNLYNYDEFRKISVESGAKSYNVENSSTIKNAIDEILDESSTSVIDNFPTYVLEFKTNAAKADGGDYQFVIQFEGSSIPDTYTAPNRGESGGGWLSGNYWVYIAVLGAIVALIAWYANNQRRLRLEEEEEEAMMLEQQKAEEARKETERQKAIQEEKERNIRLQEQLKAKEQELAKKQFESIPTVAEPDKLDMKNTIISGGGGSPVLLVSAGYFKQNFRLNKPLMTIGRNPNNDVTIPEQTVSGNHATITIEQGSFFLNDLKSTNGTFVNGTRVDKKILKSGDLIKLGGANLKFEI